MTVAIVVFVLVVALACVVGLAIAYALGRRRTGGTKVRSGSAGQGAQIDSVGVSSSLDAPGASDLGAAGPSGAMRRAPGIRSRFVALGVFAAAVFATLAARLWSMQVLSSGAYESEAERNKYSIVATPAPRGNIFDANGVALVKNRAALTVLADATVADNRDVVLRLSSVLGIPFGVVRARILDATSGAQSKRVVSRDARLRDVAFIAEHADAFPGVEVQKRAIRTYPYGALASHVLGYTGKVSDEELRRAPANRDVELGDEVGKSGVEAAFDNVLAGDHGKRKVVADADGNLVGVESEVAPTRGSDVYLTIKAPVQYAAETALAKLIAPDGIIGTGTGVAGAVVCMDARDGGIVAMASFPTFNPASFTGGISQDTWDLYASAESYYPLLNRAISGTYPAASTFKAFTGLAGMKYGFADTTRTWTCTGSWDGFGSGDVQKCWKHEGHGTLDLHEGIVQSCDVVFYDIAYDFFFAGKTQGGTISDTAMQEEVAKFGFGKACGIELSGEESGRLPTPAWKAAHWSDVPTEGVWRGGDLTNMVIGQGDVLVTPLQMAVAYGAVATGKVMRPHVLKEVRNAGDGDAGSPAISAAGEVLSTPDVDVNNLAAMRAALADVAKSNSTISHAFEEAGLDVDDVGSKTGTGEVAGKDDYAWFCCYMPKDDPAFVVSVIIEQGGGGAAVASPVGAKVMAAAMADLEGISGEVGAVAGSSGQSVEYTGGSRGRTD